MQHAKDIRKLLLTKDNEARRKLLTWEEKFESVLRKFGLNLFEKTQSGMESLRVSLPSET